MTVGNSKISYLGEHGKVWNPIEGCAPCSPGCDRCWARKYANRMASNPAFDHDAGSITGYKFNSYRSIAAWDGTLAEFPARWDEPMHWRKPQRVFVGSRSDVALWSFDAIRTVMNMAERCPQHRFLLLTKRPEQLAQKWHLSPSNVFPGVTVCTQREADEKIAELLRIPAAGYWLSVEPALENIGMARHWPRNVGIGHHRFWIVQGGESGPGARPFNAEWARALRDSCKAAGVAYWFKQDSDANYSSGQDGISYTPAGQILLDYKPYHQLPAGLRLPGEE